MYGAIFGDYVGSVYEFNNINTKEFELISPRASLTDDTYMTIAVASACLKYREHRDLVQFTRDVKQEMLRIGRRYPYPMGGYGTRFAQWLRSDNPQPYDSWGNGAVMRVSPCGWTAKSLDEAEMLGWSSAIPTHGDPEAALGAKAIAGAVYLALSGASREGILRYLSQENYPLDGEGCGTSPRRHSKVSCRATVLSAVQAFLDSSGYEDAIRTAVSLGGDTDTICAVTGALAEAYYGFPGEYLSRLEAHLWVRCHMRELEIVRAFREACCAGYVPHSKEVLLHRLDCAGVDRDTAAVISGRLTTPDRRRKLARWLDAHQDADAAAILHRTERGTQN